MKYYISANKIQKWRNENKETVCPVFNIALDDAVVDHDHHTGVVRGCLHRQANAWEGKVWNAWKRYGGNNAGVSYTEALRNLADYIDRPPTNFYHPVGVTQLCKRFGRFSKNEQVFALKLFKYKKSEIEACSNSKERIKLYRKFLTTNKYG
jgi:hypothetical protein